MTPEEMDEVFERHCAAEAANDVDGILDTLTDDVEHDVVGDPSGVLHDRALIAKRYVETFTALEDSSMNSLHRHHGENFFVDDSLCTARIATDFMGLPGNNRTISFRILHVCEFRDGRISRENVWLDGAAVMAQLAGG
ncbi:ester cyclase [Pseudonocardia sp. DSM 110487]|uniref:nuclear transport factor 2 family protein n=1 Tax=Pseudonocardia sp. DSM 110487 TaxID=2865833 RepID=UPI001C6977F0|nr:ester cyclase [Pseudonocardia sp. DSM 110487]QYN37106.1 ester cyclase [Pseudonocardia sp. DSM 110487]